MMLLRILLKTVVIVAMSAALPFAPARAAVSPGDVAPVAAAATDIPLSADERAWLSGLPVLRLGIDPTSAPLSMIDRNGEATGLAVDYLDDALRMLGVRTATVPTVDWPDTVRRASAGDIDLLPAASPRNGVLSRDFVFTAPFVEFPIMIVTREDWVTISGAHDLGGRRIAANMAQGAVASAIASFPRVDVLDVRSVADGLRAVASGDVDAYVGDIATAEYVMRRDFPAQLRLAAPTAERAQLAIAVGRRYAPLVPLLERALARISERRAQAIRNDWLRTEYTWGGSWREIARKVGPAGVLALLLLLAVTHAYFRLRRETRRRQLSEAQLADVTRHMPAVVYRFLYHADGRIAFTYVGGNPEPIFDLPAEAFIHDERRAFGQIDPRDQEALLAAVERAASSLSPLHAEMRIRDSAPERWVASHALPRRVGTAVEFTGYWIDVSERHRQATQLADAKRAAESATEAKSRFLATMSHEIRTPMHGVIGTLEMLGQTPLDEGQQRLLGTAETSAEALLQILDDVLDLSRIEAGRMPLDPTPVDLRRMVEAVVDLFASQAARKRLDLGAHVSDVLSHFLITDGARLRQVLLNLVSNALKFTAEGRVGIRVEVDGTTASTQRVRIEVTDTGIGVSPAEVSRLFSAFSQAETSTTRRFGGSGLGLAISRQLVDMLGGEIAMHSEPGRGTCVSVTLDLAVYDAAVAAESSRIPGDTRAAHAIPSSPSPASRVLDIVVAEDNAINRELVAAQLTRLGHRFCTAADGNEALAMIQARRPNVVLTDLHMPGLDGYALTRRLRENGCDVRIVAMTANAMAGERERCMAAGMDDFVTKPLRLAGLRDALALKDDAAPPPWDAAAWCETFGDLKGLPAIVQRFEATTRADLERARAVDSPAAAADWLHHVLGGMRVFGPSTEAARIETLERDMRGPAGERTMPAFPEAVELVRQYLARLSAAAARLSRADGNGSSSSK